MRSRRSIDLEIAGLAARQWGIVDRAQLLALGLSTSAIDRLVWSGRLLVLHRGVYAVGHRVLRPQAYRLAAARACGESAVVSFAAGAAHWGLRRSEATLIDVTVPRGRSGAGPASAPIAAGRAPRSSPGSSPTTFRGRPGRGRSSKSCFSGSARRARSGVRSSTAFSPASRWISTGRASRSGSRSTGGSSTTAAARSNMTERDAILAAAGIFTLRFTDLQLGRRPDEIEAALTVPLSMLHRLR